jgi:hypothetical protein
VNLRGRLDLQPIAIAALHRIRQPYPALALLLSFAVVATSFVQAHQASFQQQEVVYSSANLESVAAEAAMAEAIVSCLSPPLHRHLASEHRLE